MRKIITVISGITFFVIYLAGTAANIMYPKLQWSHDELFGLWLGLSALLFTIWTFSKFGIMHVPGNQRWALYFLYPAMMVLGGLAKGVTSLSRGSKKPSLSNTPLVLTISRPSDEAFGFTGPSKTNGLNMGSPFDFL
jgi:hypothetical protein